MTLLKQDVDLVTTTATAYVGLQEVCTTPAIFGVFIRSNPCNFCKGTGIVARREGSDVTEDTTTAAGNYPAQNRYIIDPPHS